MQEMMTGRKSAWSRGAIGAPPDGGMQGSATELPEHAMTPMGGVAVKPLMLCRVLPCGRSAPRLQSVAAFPDTPEPRSGAHGGGGARSIAATIGHGARGISDASGVRIKAAPGR